MNTSRHIALLFLVVCLAVVASAQDTPASAPTFILCNQASVCSHRIVNGELFETITSDGMVITVGLVEAGKYIRANVSIANGTPAPVDVLPKDFTVEVLEPKHKTLRYVAPGKIAKSSEHHAGWANFANRMGGALAEERTTSQTTSSGSVTVHGSDGSSANGSYSGNGTTTTSSPDYAARQRAAENIRQRNAAVAAANTRMMESALTANTVAPGQALGGYVYFEGDSKATKLHPRILIAGKLYEFQFGK